MQEIPKTLFPFARNYSLKSAAVVKLVAETCRVEGGMYVRRVYNHSNLMLKIEELRKHLRPLGQWQ